MATFSDKLNAVLEDRSMSNRGLANRIDPENPESARRTIRKWRSGQQTATQASRNSVTDALGLERGSLDPDDEEDSLVRALIAAIGEVKLRRVLDEVPA
jgi:hypothetical protein